MKLSLVAFFFAVTTSSLFALSASANLAAGQCNAGDARSVAVEQAGEDAVNYKHPSCDLAKYRNLEESQAMHNCSADLWPVSKVVALSGNVYTVNVNNEAEYGVRCTYENEGDAEDRGCECDVIGRR